MSKQFVCINSKNYRNPLFDGPRPQEGDIVTVLSEETFDDILYYQLAEFSQEHRYAAWRFAPLSALTDYRTLKQIRRGSRQAADTAAMEAMYDAIEAGMSKEEANEIFANTYKQFLSHDSSRSKAKDKRYS